MSTWQDSLLEAMTEYVQRRFGPDGSYIWGHREAIDPEAKVVSYEEDVPSAYYCDTCGPDPYTVTFTLDNGETVRDYTSLGELLQELI